MHNFVELVQRFSKFIRAHFYFKIDTERIDFKDSQGIKIPLLIPLRL